MPNNATLDRLEAWQAKMIPFLETIPRSAETAGCRLAESQARRALDSGSVPTI